MAPKLLMGNEAFAHGALEAGVRVVAGYPGTPSSEVIETIAKLRESGCAHDVYVEWSVNEKAALELAFAASLSGARALFTCKQVGLSVASDALMSLNYVGTKGGLVLFVADDPGPISSQTEQDTRRFASFAKVPVLDPATPEQGFEMMKAAFDLSEKYGTPVIVRPTTRINHASTYIDVEDETFSRPLEDAGFVRDPQEYVIFPRRSYQAHGQINDRLRMIARDYSTLPELSRFNQTMGCSGIEELSAANDGKNGNDTHSALQFGPFGESQNGTFDGSRNGSHAESTNGSFGESCDGPRNGSRNGTHPNDSHLSDSRQSESGTDYSRSCDSSTSDSHPSEKPLGIVAGGVSTQYALEALDLIADEAENARSTLPRYEFMQIGTPYPFPEETAKAFLRDVGDVLVLEELDNVLEDELLRIRGTENSGRRIFGKATDSTSKRGENSTEICARDIARFFDGNADRSHNPAKSESAHVEAAESQEGGDAGLFEKLVEGVIGPESLLEYEKTLPIRPPVLCAGCPHRASFHAVSKALAKLGISRDDAVFCGDIGCYTLGNTPPLDAVDTCLCMGGGFTMAQGIAAADPRKKAIAFIGDSTFFASGMTGTANAVYNDHDVTFCILDNSTTAMTGMQPHPGTGITLMGGKNRPIKIEGVLRAIGLDHIWLADPLSMEDAAEKVAQAIAVDGPSAVIFQRPCIWLDRFGSPAQIDAGVCTGCKKCITEIGCPAIWFDSVAKGGKSGNRGQAVIDPAQCNGCSLCVQICPFSAIGVEGKGSPISIEGGRPVK